MDNLKSALNSYLEDQPNVPLSYAVYNVLLNEIITFNIKPESKLLVSHIAEELDISMTPVREAIFKLSEAGLVSVDHGKKAYVSGFNQDDYNNLHYFRASLDSLAAEQVCALGNESDISALDELCDEMSRLYYQLDSDPNLLPTLATVDLEFHHQLALASKIPLLIEQYERILPRATFFRQFFYPRMKAPYVFPDLHTHITYALKHCDPQSAVDAVRFHYRAGSHLKLFSEL